MALNPNDFEFMGRWVMPTMEMAPWHDWGNTNVLRDLDLVFDGTCLYFDGYCYLHISARQKISSALVSELESGEFAFLEKFTSLSDLIMKEFLSFSQTLTGNSKGLTEFKEFFRLHHELCGPWWAIFPISAVVQEYLKKVAAEEGFSLENVAQSIHPRKNTFVMDEHSELLKIKKELQKRNVFDFVTNKNLQGLKNTDPALYQKILSHTKKYEWIGTHHLWGTPLTPEKVFENLISLSEPHVPTSNPVYSKKLKKLIEIASGLSWLRFQFAEVSDIASFRARPLFTHLAKKLDLSYDDFIWLYDREVVDLIENKKAPHRRTIDERKKGVGSITEGNYMKVMSGKELQTYAEMFVEKFDTNIKEFRGMVAHKGKVRGVAQVLLSSHKLETVKEGDILVAPETTPDFLPAMKVAAAFITDNGGITSHAAIVARELKKPCIVGTKMATKVLKTGDMIEVDANTGTVRILGKKAA